MEDGRVSLGKCKVRISRSSTNSEQTTGVKDWMEWNKAAVTRYLAILAQGIDFRLEVVELRVHNPNILS